MTTRILIVNFGPASVKVIAHDPDGYSKFSEQKIAPSAYASELYVHQGQRVTIVEEVPAEVQVSPEVAAKEKPYSFGGKFP